MLSSPSPSISPGNIWTQMWKELAAASPDPKATIQEGILNQVETGIGVGAPSPWCGQAGEGSPAPRFHLVSLQPLGRMGHPAEVAAAAVFLASEASFCTGCELFVTGGAELGYGIKAKRGAPVEAPDTLPEGPPFKSGSSD